MMLLKKNTENDAEMEETDMVAVPEEAPTASNDTLPEAALDDNAPAQKNAVSAENAPPATSGRPVILQVLPEMESGGVERGTVDMSQAIIDAGWTSLVASHGGGLISSLTRQGATHFTLPVHSKNPLQIMLNVKRLERLIRKYNVSLVHARSRAPAWVAMMAAKRCGVPFVTTFHGHYSMPNEFKRWYNGVMVKGDRVIAISDFTADHIRDNYTVNETYIRTIHRGVDLDVFSPEKISQHRLVTLANQWRLPDDLPVIFMPGRLTRWKGQHVLIRALGVLERRDYFCIIAGHEGDHGRYRHELEDMIMNLGLGGNVRIVPPTRDMPAAYMLSHIVTCPSTRPEAFGRVPAEAGAMGKPTIASDHGGARETVIHGETGWLVHPSNTGAFSMAIDEALSVTTQGYKAMAEAAQNHSRKHFSLDTMRRKTLDVYKELIPLC